MLGTHVFDDQQQRFDEARGRIHMSSASVAIFFSNAGGISGELCFRVRNKEPTARGCGCIHCPLADSRPSPSHVTQACIRSNLYYRDQYRDQVDGVSGSCKCVQINAFKVRPIFSFFYPPFPFPLPLFHPFYVSSSQAKDYLVPWDAGPPQHL